MKKDKKCDKCENDAVVYFSVVSGKGKTTRKRYCKSCAILERLKIAPQILKSQMSQPTSMLGLVQQEMEKSAKAGPDANEAPAIKIKRLEKEMNTAVSNENYLKAAKIRDQIASVKNMQKEQGNT